MEFDDFLREAAPFLGLQWQPFRRKGVKRKVERRFTQMGLSNFEEYLLRVKKDSEEQRLLSKIFTVTISRFFRDKKVFDTLRQYVFPDLLKGDRKELKIWSIGCASGEEPYSLSLVWKEAFERSHSHIGLSLLATDIDEEMLKRAKEGKYKESSLKEVPEEILRKFFEREGEFYLLDEVIRESTEFRRHDILREEPFRGMDIIFCRNLAFTYFSKERRTEVLKKIASSLKERGYLVIGRDESLPLTYPTLFVPTHSEEKIYQRFPSGFCRQR